MAFDERLGDRIRKKIGRRRGITEKQMFGGLAFLLHGNLCCGVYRNDMIVRVSPEDGTRGLTLPNVRPFDITGRPMKGWLLIRPAGLATDAALSKWVEAGLKHAASLQPK